MTSINFHFFCFAEELANFWRVFETRIYSDRKLPKTLIDLLKNNIISIAQFQLIVHLSNEQFQYHLVFHLVRASVTSGVNIITSFTTFLWHNRHYTTLYKQWKELGKKMS